MLMRYTHRVGGGGWLFKPLIFLFSVLRIGAQLGELPDPQLLSGVERLSSLTPPPLVSINAENVQPSQPPIQLYTGQGLVPQKQAKAGGPVVVAPGMPAVPLKLAERMWAGEFVDFCELPPAKGRARPVTGSMEGQLILVQAADLYQTKKLIPDLATWSQCFALFMATTAMKQPKRIPDLLAYMATIAKASQKYRWPSWLVYDQNFRQQAAESGNCEWSKIDPSIYAQCFNGMAISDEGWCRHCHSIEHAAENCPTRQWVDKGVRKRGWSLPAPPAKRGPTTTTNEAICRKFNRYGGDCKFGKACKFQHICSQCKGDHPATKCSSMGTS